MGQKVSPIGMRVGIIRDWQSRWYADDKGFGSLLIEDVKIREFIENYYEKLSNAAQDKRKADPQISRIEIERTKNRVTIIVRTAHPGVVIGQDGKSIEGLKKQLEKMVNAGVKKDSKNKKTIQINIDYAWEEAATTYGRLGVKVWICRGEVLPGEMVKEPEAPKQRPMRGRNRNNRNRRPNGRAPQQNAAPAKEQAPVENKGGNE